MTRYRKALILTLTCLVSLSVAAGCGSTAQTGAPPAQEQAVQPTTPAAKPHQRILIAYFSRADNTVVTNPAAVDVDATTSASLLPPGNVAKLATLIQEQTGGDLFPINVAEPYPGDYDQVLNRAVTESSTDARPALATHITNIDDYDTIFIGYPNWDYGAPMAVRTFLEEYNLTGKTIIPFCAYGTGGLSSSVRQISRSVPNSTITAPFGIGRADMSQGEAKIAQWLPTVLAK